MSRNLVLFAALVLSVAPAFSGTLTFTLDAPVQPGTPGGFVIFQGTLQNVGAPDLFLNDIVIGFTPPAGTYLSEDHNFFFANVPGVLLADESYTGPIFRLLIAAGTPPGTYLGSAILIGGVDEFAIDRLNSSPAGDFAVVITPEPQTMGLMLAGLAALALLRRRAS